MKLLHFLGFKRADETPKKFSEFFLHAPERKKEAVLEEAAKMANKEQMKVFEKAQLKIKAH